MFWLLFREILKLLNQHCLKGRDNVSLESLLYENNKICNKKYFPSLQKGEMLFGERLLDMQEQYVRDS